MSYFLKNKYTITTIIQGNVHEIIKDGRIVKAGKVHPGKNE